MRKYRARTFIFFFIQTPLKFDIDPKEQHKLIYRRRRNYVVYKEMHSTSIKSKHRILICPFYIQIMGLHFKSFDVGKVYLWKLFTVGLNFGKKSCLFDIHIYFNFFIFGSVCHLTIYIASRSRSWINDEKRSIKKFFIAKL